MLSACEKYRRDPATLIRHVTVGVNLRGGEFSIPGANPIHGSVLQIAERFAEFADEGVEHVSLMLDPWTAAGVENFGSVIEALRR